MFIGARISRTWLVAAACIASASCHAQPESLAAAAAPALTDTPVGPLPGEPDEHLQEPQNPFGDSDVARVEGRQLFVAFNCSGCHGDHGGGGMGPSLRDQAWLYGHSPAKVANSIAEGRAHGMPAWGNKLNTEQVWKLAGYIGSLRTSAEPSPPPGS